MRAESEEEEDKMVVKEEGEEERMEVEAQTTLDKGVRKRSNEPLPLRHSKSASQQQPMIWSQKQYQGNVLIGGSFDETHMSTPRRRLPHPAAPALGSGAKASTQHQRRVSKITCTCRR